MSARVAMLIPYFGRFPEWMDLYLWSCSRNPMIDFIFLTDCEVPRKTYGNTQFISTSFKEYCVHVSKELGISFHSQHVYKLCDLKPFLGMVHENLLAKYDFWGYGDLDIIYGDLSSIVNEENLSKYELITTSIAYIVGHFTLIKKGSRYHKIATLIPDWKKKLEEEKHLTMDEIDFNQVARPNYKIIDLLWLNIGRKLFNDRTRFYQTLLKFYKNPAPVRMEEWRTTFTPIEGAVYKYDLSTRRFYIPGMERPKKLKMNQWVDLPYLHFYEFKHSMKDRAHPTWTGNFYKIPSDHVFSEKDQIEFTTQSIRLASHKTEVK